MCLCRYLQYSVCSTKLVQAKQTVTEFKKKNNRRENLWKQINLEYVKKIIQESTKFLLCQKK